MTKELQQLKNGSSAQTTVSDFCLGKTKKLYLVSDFVTGIKLS